jgi:hypothetical protein
VSEPDDLPEIDVPDDLRGGVWANLVLVVPGVDEVTLDFVRMDPHLPPPGAGVVVARVAVAPRHAMDLVTDLSDALATHFRTRLDLDDDAAH